MKYNYSITINGSAKDRNEAFNKIKEVLDKFELPQTIIFIEAKNEVEARMNVDVNTLKDK